MNVSLKNIDAVSGVITVEVTKADYADKVEKGLRTFRQRANIPGFRKGMVPMGMVKKMYGKATLIDEVNKLVNENLFTYIRNNKVNILGEPLPSLEQKEIDFNTQEDFEFVFDVALAPEIDMEINKEVVFPYYNVAIDEEMVNSQVDAYKSQMGTYEKVDQVEEKDMVKGTLVELENGAPKEGGIQVENAIVMPNYMKNDEEKAKFVGAQNNSVITFNPTTAFDGAEAEIASLLKIAKEDVSAHAGDFNFEIMEITRHKPAELNEELFDKVFGEGKVKTEEEFRGKIKASVEEQTIPESNFKFFIDARPILMEKAGEVTFADEILKRWLKVSDEKRTEQDIEEGYPEMINDLKFHLIKETLIKKNDIKIEESDIQDFAKRVAKAQFAQYGMLGMTDEMLEGYAKEMMKNKQTANNILERTIEEKLVDWLKQVATLDEKTVSVDEFRELLD